MKMCSYCGAQYPDEAEVCAVDQHPLKGLAESASRVRRQFRSAWTLCLGILLACLPIVAFAVAVIYLAIVPCDTLNAPEDCAWRGVLVLSALICFAGMCLIPSVIVLVFHFRHSSAARWALVCAVTQIVMIWSVILFVYVKSAA
jgi:hypothetical protein